MVREELEREQREGAPLRPLLMGRFGPDLRYLFVNEAAAAWMGRSTEECIGRTMAEAGTPSPLRERAEERLRHVFHSGEPATFETNDGTYLFEVQMEPERDAGGRVASVLTIARDVTNRWQMVEALRESEERFRLVARATNDIVYDWDVATGEIWWSEALRTVLGYSPGEAGAGRLDFAWWEANMHPDDHLRVRETLERAMAGGRQWSAEYRFRRRDGSWATVLDRGFATTDDVGRPQRMIGSMVDITEREVLAAQLRQAQKMEAVGRLAGGIAHDFNNVLTAILSTAELAMSELEPTHPVYADLVEIRAAGVRAAALTRQLLAFSRRQVLQPQLLDPNEVVHGAQQLLGRLLGEQVRLEVVPDPGAGPVRADRGQLEQVLMNLAVNGRDAMPEGGTLSIVVGRRDESQAEVDDHGHGPGDHAPGRYVTISVRDTGAGMDDATLARAFEPFFTTKPVGQGTGLGLATVYGIVQQSGGFLRAESTPGSGTTVTLHLPEDQGEGAPAVAAPVDAPGSIGGASGTVLLAEDEAAVRGATRRMLEQAGYDVLEAEDGVEALELWGRHAGAIRLVLSDVVMPRMGGPELAERLRARGASVPVLLMSGYDERPEGTGRLPTDASILSKPFGQGELLSAVEAAVGAPSARRV
ncbi:MAG TPA: PAS domain-containing protein [Gemmatimonadaceae bacterium]|nr:PAS domain-containing protein [Gemmatimonadaceae bacterium]